MTLPLGIFIKRGSRILTKFIKKIVIEHPFVKQIVAKTSGAHRGKHVCEVIFAK